MDDQDIFGDISRMHQKQITIHEGDEGLAETGRVLYVEPDWTTDDLLQAAGRRLDLASTPKRMFNANGMEVADVMMIEDREVIFFTQGGEYVAPRLVDENSGADGPSSGLPAIVGAYKVCEFLGKGGFGEVRVGQHQLTGERVALKFLRKSAIADMGAAERTTTEIQCLTALKHPNIIRLVQHINSPQNVIMVFELAEGGDLYQFLCSAPGQRVDEDEGRALFRQIVSGVGYAHNQHICHRDMKLDNVLLSRPGCLREIKLADFGLSDFYRPGATMRTNCGSISYLAPEVFRGTSNAGPPLDVWSLGVILFALLCGRLPFEGSDLQGTNRPREAAIRRRIMECRYKPVESLSPEAKDLVRRMLKLDPNERASIPEIFNHSWLRFRNVTTLDHQPGRKDERGGLRDAFPDGASASRGSPRNSAGESGDGASPRNPTLPRGSASPRLAPLSPRSASPPGTSECKVPVSPRRCSPGSPRISLTTLDPLDAKSTSGGGRWVTGVAGGDVDMAEAGALAVEAMGRRAGELAESKLGFSSFRRGGGGDRDEGDKKGKSGEHNGSDSDSEDSHTSRAGRGGRGRDFSATLNPGRATFAGGSPGGANSSSTWSGSSFREPMTRMNSRLGLTHPARSKTMVVGLGSLTGTGGGASPSNAAGVIVSSSTATGGGSNLLSSGVVKARTMDLSHHLTSSAAVVDGGSSLRSLSPRHTGRSTVEGGGLGTLTRQRSWQSGGNDSQPSPSPRQRNGAAWDSGGHDTQTTRTYRPEERDCAGRDSNRDAEKSSLPPLSPRSIREHADREQVARRLERDRDKNKRGDTVLDRRIAHVEERGERGHAEAEHKSQSARNHEGSKSADERDPRLSSEFRLPDSGAERGGKRLSGFGSSPSSSRPSSPQRSLSSPTGGLAGENVGVSRDWSGWRKEEKDYDERENSGDSARNNPERRTRLPSPRGALPRESDRDTEGGVGTDKDKSLSFSVVSESAIEVQAGAARGRWRANSGTEREEVGGRSLSQPRVGKMQGSTSNDGPSIKRDKGDTLLKGLGLSLRSSIGALESNGQVRPVSPILKSLPLRSATDDAYNVREGSTPPQASERSRKSVEDPMKVGKEVEEETPPSTGRRKQTSRKAVVDGGDRKEPERDNESGPGGEERRHHNSESLAVTSTSKKERRRRSSVSSLSSTASEKSPGDATLVGVRPTPQAGMVEYAREEKPSVADRRLEEEKRNDSRRLTEESW